MKINFILLLILIFFSCNGLDENNPEEINSELSSVLSGEQNLIAAKIDSFFNDRFNRGLFNGTVLYSDSGKIVYLSAFGFADHKEKEKLKINSQFQLASVSKPITAYAIMLLVEKGEMAYSDSIRKYFPEFPYENITIHQLLIHRTGLPNYMYFADKYWKD
ncbi:MAG: serine hydrolase, partial [Melioribacteraceae bacterium]|nr:serine hydrolase [Melioribacteraceae bacterium]